MDTLLGTINQSVTNVGTSKIEQASSRFQKAAPDKMDAAAKDFEAVFLSQMMTHMFSGIETNEMFGGGHAESIYKSMMVDEYGKMVAASGGLGLADHIKSELIALQEKAQNGTR